MLLSLFLFVFPQTRLADVSFLHSEWLPTIKLQERLGDKKGMTKEMSVISVMTGRRCRELCVWRTVCVYS